MPKTLEEQIASKCIHFNGLMNKVCKKGIEYDSFGQVKLGVIPCMKGGTGTCVYCQFLTYEQAMEKNREAIAEGMKTVAVLIEAKRIYKQTKQSGGTFKCPNGDHNARYARMSNGHFWIACKDCQIRANE